MSGPPRLPRWLLHLILPVDVREAAIGDLEEMFQRRVARDGGARARLWYWRQPAAFLVRFVMARMTERIVDLQITARQLNLHVRQGIRSLRHTPGFTLVTIVTLAAGIGSATTAFTAFDATLLEPLPYEAAERLVVMAETRRDREISVAYPDFQDWKQTAQSFDAMASFRGIGVTLTGDVPETAAAQVVSADLFRVLGTPPLIGRAFDAEDDQRGAPDRVILGHDLWQRLYGADPDVIGRSIGIDGSGSEIIGVMPKSFVFPGGLVYGRADLYLSVGARWIEDLTDRDSHPGLAVVGLLRDGVTVDQAREEMRSIAAALRERHPASNAEIGVVMRDAISELVGDLRGRLETLTMAASLLLLIGCANVAGLSITRALSRRRELMIRAALGEPRAALAASLLVEHLMLAAAGAVGGVLLAFVLTRALQPLTTDLPRLDGLAPDSSALVFALCVMVATALTLGLLPLVWIGRQPPASQLGQRGQSAQGLRTRHALVGLQLALAVVLVASALMFTTSFRRLAADMGGIDPHDTLTFETRLSDEYSEAQSIAFYRSLYERLAAHPGVMAVGGISTLPFSGAGAQSGIGPFGSDPASHISVDVAVVTPGYFEAMGVAFVRGRNFGPHQPPGGQAVAVVDERLAKRFWPGEDPLGKRLQGWGFPELHVIGVVRHVKNYGASAISREELYISHLQRPTTRLYTVVRSAGDPAALVPFARHAVSERDGRQPISRVRTMHDLVGRTTAGPRLVASISTAFGIVAAVLAIIGLNGLVAYTVELRRREAAIRLALGADSRRIVQLVMRRVLGALVAGSAAGTAGAIAAGRWLRSELFGVSATDPVLLGTACLTLTAAALIAAWLPARRAARVPAALVLQQD